MWKQTAGVLLAATLGVGAAWLASDLINLGQPANQAALPLPAGGDFTLQSVNR
ncbi:MAG: hypothetical protein R3E93_10540 [Thiothrix sp.]